MDLKGEYIYIYIYKRIRKEKKWRNSIIRIIYILNQL